MAVLTVLTLTTPARTQPTDESPPDQSLPAESPPDQSLPAESPPAESPADRATPQESLDDDERDARLLPWSLIVLGGLTLGGALALDFTLSDERDELARFQTACAAGPCDAGRALAVADDVQDGKVTIGILLAAGALAAGAGIVLLLTRGRAADEAPRATAAPMLSEHDVGAVLRVSF